LSYTWSDNEISGMFQCSLKHHGHHMLEKHEKLNNVYATLQK
jgi:hypothetical protein